MAETILEFSGNDEATQQVIARVHFWIDVLVELPLLFLVLVTGALLFARVWPGTWILWLKVVAGLTAVALNAYCAVMVVFRYRHRDEAKRVQFYQRRVLFSGIGVPFALVALGLGFTYFLRFS